MAQKPARPQVLTRTPGTAPTGILQVVHLNAAEHTWEIAPGTVVKGYGYNAQVPGPTVEATVGDTLLVRFTNSLPEPTSICWAGLHAPAMTDVDPVPFDPVPPGGTFEHRLELPYAGTFTYHPQPDHSRQTERGLYGVVVVRDPTEPVLEAERVLVLSDLSSTPPDADAAWPPVPGNRDGGLLLVNGVRQAQILVIAGHRERWRLVNATVARRLQLSLSRQPLTMTSTGRGLLAAPVQLDEVAMAPGGRLDLVAGPFEAKQRLTLDVELYDHEGRSLHPQPVAIVHVV